MADTLGGFNLQTAGFGRLVQVAIHRSVIDNLRARGAYAIPESLLKLGAKPGSTFVRRATTWSDVDPTLTALTEGVPPDPRKLAEDDIEVTVIEVGDYIPVFSQAAYQDGGAENLVMQATKKVARMVELAFENTAKATWAAGTTDLYGGTGNAATLDVAAGDVLTTAMVDEIVTQLRERDVETFGDGNYRIVGHPRLFKPLLTEAGSNGAGFVNAAIRGAAGDVAGGILGQYHGATFVSAGSRGIKLAGAGTGAIDVFKGVALGRQSLALSDLGSIQTYVEPGGGPTDPLHQVVATVGFRGFIGGAIVSVANTSDGAGTLDADIQRSVLFEAAGA